MKIYNGSRDKIAAPTTHTVAIVSAGYVPCKDTDRMTLRKNGREDWSLFYCEEGVLSFDGQPLEAGQCWIYPPNTPQTYIAYRKDCATYHYLHFTGSDLFALLGGLGIPFSAAFSVHSRSLPSLFERIRNCLKEQGALSLLQAEYHALHLFSKLAQQQETIAEAPPFKQVTDEMEHSFAAPYHAEYYARLMNLSVSRFNHLFKECIGLSPYTYYLNLRISNAANLLENTDMKIKDIAEYCGFSDPYYFTQAFRKAKGRTPTEYRKLYS